MRKSDVETHADNWARGGNPAINIKLWREYRPELDSHDISEHFGCDLETAERAGEFWFESAQESFWNTIPDVVSEIFPGCECYSEGRSGGWLVVHGLPEVESWDAVMLGKWSKLCRIVRDEIKYLCSREYMLEDIEDNQWAKPHAERFNFLDRNGETVCIADLKAQAIDAGFGPVVRA
jgi:hypothetical protein